MKTFTFTQQEFDDVVNKRLDKLRRVHAREIDALRAELKTVRRSHGLFARLRERFRRRPADQILQTDSDTRSR